MHWIFTQKLFKLNINNINSASEQEILQLHLNICAISQLIKEYINFSNNTCVWIMGKVHFLTINSQNVPPSQQWHALAHSMTNEDLLLV